MLDAALRAIAIARFAAIGIALTALECRAKEREKPAAERLEGRELDALEAGARDCIPKSFWREVNQVIRLVTGPTRHSGVPRRDVRYGEVEESARFRVPTRIGQKRDGTGRVLEHMIHHDDIEGARRGHVGETPDEDRDARSLANVAAHGGRRIAPVH